MSELEKEEKLKQLIGEFSQSMVRDNARLQVFSEGDGDVGGIIGNRQGYLCFGIEMLNAAFAEVETNCNAETGNLSIDPSYLFDSNSAFIPKWLGRREDLKPILNVTPTSAKFILGGVLLILVSGFIFSVIGLITVIKWVLS